MAPHLCFGRMLPGAAFARAGCTEFPATVVRLTDLRPASCARMAHVPHNHPMVGAASQEERG